MAVTVRQYEPSDRAFLVRSLEDLLDHLVELDPWGRLRRQPAFGESYTASLLNRVEENDGLVLVAESEGTGVGIAAGIITKTTPEDALECYPITRGILLELYVRQECRGLGVGRQLVEGMEEYFRVSGCSHVGTEVFVPNEQARAFYRRLGYVDRDVYILKRLT